MSNDDCNDRTLSQFCILEDSQTPRPIFLYSRPSCIMWDDITSHKNTTHPLFILDQGKIDKKQHLFQSIDRHHHYDAQKQQYSDHRDQDDCLAMTHAENAFLHRPTMMPNMARNAKPCHGIPPARNDKKQSWLARSLLYLT